MGTQESTLRPSGGIEPQSRRIGGEGDKCYAFNNSQLEPEAEVVETEAEAVEVEAEDGVQEDVDDGVVDNELICEPCTDDEVEMGVERPKAMRAPHMPSRQKVLEHRIAHIPFRRWCADCVSGKAHAARHEFANKLTSTGGDVSTMSV